MEIKLAIMEDVTLLYEMYANLIAHMKEQQLEIWDDIYPCCMFEEDVAKQRLYVLKQEHEVVAAFALCEYSDGAAHVNWKFKEGKALYLDRLGVNVKFTRRGIGRMMLKHAISIAEEKGVDVLRLFVVDANLPAIQLYEQYGFIQAAGIYDEAIDDNLTLHEYGYEILCK